ncbi:hypothetical protein MRX96_037572 [Rhipicephalus microplus]
MISNALLDETEQELLQELRTRNPEAGILLARRMGSPNLSLLSLPGDLPLVELLTMKECTCACLTEHDQRLARTAGPQGTDMLCAHNRRNRDVQGAVKITEKIEVGNACRNAS